MAKIKPKALLAQSKQKRGPTRTSLTTIITYLILGALVVSLAYYAYQYWLSKAPAGAEGVVGN